MRACDANSEVKGMISRGSASASRRERVFNLVEMLVCDSFFVQISMFVFTITLSCVWRCLHMFASAAAAV